ncbi:MAG: T9SS type A sorting domain-containing protein [Bacteroidia bacterium]|nr:T9SS type A sorting domain-containing protein [Bacteroidia bacterium]
MKTTKPNPLRINRMVKTFLISLLIISSNLAFAQYGYFEQGYGTSDDEEGFDIQVDPSFNVFMAGSITLGGSNKNVYLVYTDSIGDTIWTNTVGGNSTDVGRAVWQKGASSWFVGGYTNSKGGGGYDPYFIKIENNGNASFDVALGGSDDEYVFDIAQCIDGTFILVGYSNVGGTNKEILVIKADSTNGNVIWSKTFGGLGNQEGKAVISKTNGNIVITGTNYGGSTPQGFLLELDSTGSQLIYQTLAQTFSSYINSFSLDRNGGYWLAGYTANGMVTNALIVHLNSSGLYTSHTTFGGTGNEEFNTITRVGNALFMAGSTTSYGEGGSDLYFVVADSVGNFLVDDFAGGTGTDYANGLFHRNGLIYLVGYNNSFGVSESGNMYGARINVYQLTDVIASVNDLQQLTPTADDCTMPRILYVDKMLGSTNEDTLDMYGFDFCRQCTGSTITESDITGNSGFYEGIIGNPYRENELLAFCQTHGFNYLYFYGSAYLFAKTGKDINSGYSVTTGSGNVNLIDYLNEKLYAFIAKAKLQYGINHVGIVGGDLPNTPPAENIFFRTGDFNSFTSSIHTYNYKFVGKIGQIVLEDEFWRSHDSIGGPSKCDTLFTRHKLYLKRMLTVARNDFNIRFVDDYIGRLMGDGPNWYVYDSCWRANAAVKPLIQQRASELEEVTDSLLNRKRITRIFMVYANPTRFPNTKGQSKHWLFNGNGCQADYVSHCTCPDLSNSISGVDNDCYEDAIQQYMPWHNLFTSYNTMMFGHRNKIFYASDSITRVYPIFYAEAACLNDSLRLERDTSDNYLGYWLATPKTGENRTLKLAEELFRDNFPGNFYYNDPDRGPGLKVNGFVYFHYQLLKRIHRYNVNLSQQTTNFSDANATPRIDQDTSISDNVCWWNIPYNGNGLYGDVNPGKIGRTPKPQPTADLTAHPNPAHRVIEYGVSFSDKNLKGDASVLVELYDIYGRLVFSSYTTHLNGQLNVLPLARGIYYLKTTTTINGTVFFNTQKIILEQ